MKTDTEIKDEAVRKCPYDHHYTGHGPWVEGYVLAAKEYEEQLERVRELLRKQEGGSR